MVALAFFGAAAFLPLALNEVRGQAPVVAGLALTAATLTWTGGSWLQARIVGRWSRRSMVFGGLVSVAAGIALTASTLVQEAPVWGAVLGWGVGGLGMGITFPAWTLAILSEAVEGAEGGASAAVQLANTVGVAIGTSVSGAIVALGGAAGTPTSVDLAAVFGLMAVAALGASLAAREIPGGPSA